MEDIKIRRLGWAGHIVRMEEERNPKRVLTFRSLMSTIVAFYIFIQQILVENILNMVYTLRFFLLKMQFVS